MLRTNGCRRKIRQFLLDAVSRVRARARSCPDLRPRVDLDDSRLQACLDAVTGWPTASLTLDHMAWQLHILS